MKTKMKNTQRKNRTENEKIFLSMYWRREIFVRKKNNSHTYEWKLSILTKTNKTHQELYVKTTNKGHFLFFFTYEIKNQETGIFFFFFEHLHQNSPVLNDILTLESNYRNCFDSKTRFSRLFDVCLTPKTRFFFTTCWNNILTLDPVFRSWYTETW